MGQVATTRPDIEGYDNVASAILTLRGGGIASLHQSWASHVSDNSMRPVPRRSRIYNYHATTAARMQQASLRNGSYGPVPLGSSRRR